MQAAWAQHPSIVGAIIDEESLHRRCRTAFLRRYNISPTRFDRADDPDYEYQDEREPPN